MSCMDLMPSPNPLPLCTRFPFDDDCRTDLDERLDQLAEEHPEIAEPLRSWRQDSSAKKKRTDTEGKESAEKEVGRRDSGCGDNRQQQDPEKGSGRGLDTKLRNTVPDMRREQEEEQDRVGRSQSAPPSQQHPGAETAQSGGAQGREPVVRHIPIYVEGRDEPVIPKDFVDSPFPREKRNMSRESSPVPPTRRTVPDHHVEPQPRPQHTTSVHINHSQDRQTPIEIKINHDQPTASAQKPPPAPKPPLGPLEKVQAVQEEVGSLKERVEQYAGGSRQDKEYVYLDEMLTRNLLKLDDIETDGKEDVRAARKEAIRQIQRCISHLEGKAPSSVVQGDSGNTDSLSAASEEPSSETDESSSVQSTNEPQPTPS